MKQLPTLPFGLWVGSRDGFANYSSSGNYEYRQFEEIQTKTSIIVFRTDGQRIGGSGTWIHIPEVIWKAGLLPKETTAYLEGAVVHAQLLARGGAAAGVSIDSKTAREVGTLNDLASTIQTIRQRLWSIPLDAEAQQNVYDLITDLTSRITDPAGRAAVLRDLFPDVEYRNDGPPVKVLGRLPWASHALSRAIALTGYALDPEGKITLHDRISEGRRKMGIELFASLGVSREVMDRAMAINNGFDLITVGATIAWMREVHRLGRMKIGPMTTSPSGATIPAMNYMPYRFSDNNSSHQLSYVPYYLDRLSNIYGWKELLNPRKEKEMQAYLITAIKRLTEYKKNLQRRQKVTHG